MLLNDATIYGPAICDWPLGTDHTTPTLMALIEYHNEQQMQKLASVTMKNYHTTQWYVKKFLAEKLYRNDIFLSHLKYKFILDFERFLFDYIP